MPKNTIATTDIQSQLAPSRIGQATAVEQSRAVAEVQAAVIVAQQCPRNQQAAVAEMRQSCAQRVVADRAFFRFPRGGQNVSGATVHLARELARCWSNVQYGVNELRRDDDLGQSEMQAWAWDVERNTRVSATFISPHKRDKRGGAEKLVDLRDIYEANSNAGARRVREAIFAILPDWFIEEAKDLCMKTLSGGDSEKPLAQRIADAAQLFGKLGVTLDQIEDKLGRKPNGWTEHDLAQLRVIYGSLNRGEVTVEEEFPTARVTVEEITGTPAATPVPAEENTDA